MNIYARISLKYYPYMNNYSRKAYGIYKLINRNGFLWRRVSLWDKLDGQITYNFYVCDHTTSHTYVKFEEWHLTKWATRYNKYREQNELSNRPS